MDQSDTLGELESMAGEGMAVEYVTFRLSSKHLMAPQWLRDPGLWVKKRCKTPVEGSGQTLHWRRVAWPIGCSPWIPQKFEVREPLPFSQSKLPVLYCIHNDIDVCSTYIEINTQNYLRNCKINFVVKFKFPVSSGGSKNWDSTVILEWKYVH